jgi:hypothetical protein
LPSPNSGEKPSSKATLGTSKAAERHAHAAAASRAARSLAVVAMDSTSRTGWLLWSLDKAPPSLSSRTKNLTRLGDLNRNDLNLIQI